MNDNSKTIFQLGTDSLGAILHPRQHSEAVSTQADSSQTFLKCFRSSLEKTSAYLGESAPKELLDLIENARFSNPIGNSASMATEQSLLLLAEKMKTEAMQENSLSSSLIAEANKLFAVRSTECF